MVGTMDKGKRWILFIFYVTVNTIIKLTITNIITYYIVNY